MKNKILALIFALILLCPAMGDVPWWSDIWTNAAYRSTNGEANNFSAYVLRSEGKIGPRFLVNGIAVDPYLAYYGVGSQDKNYWNNNIALGGGLRVLPFLNFKTSNWTDEWIPDIKLFAESLHLTVLNDKQTADSQGVNLSDVRAGIDIWHEWNLKDIDKSASWAELWGNLSYRNTNFFALQNNFPGDQYKTYLLYLQTKYGMHLNGGIRPYICAYLTASGVPKAWLNSLYYGVGLRMEPFREQKDPPEILRKFKMFIEVLNIAWLKENTPPRPSYDLVFGIDFTFGR